MAQTPCILLCESPSNGQHQLAEKLRRAGVSVELAEKVSDIHRRLQHQFYHGVAIDLLLPEQDGISLALEIRRIYPDLPVMVLTTRNGTGTPSTPNPGPDWLAKTASQARLVFALKQATQRTGRRGPRVLHVENDDLQAQLVESTIGGNVQLVRVRDVAETEIALLKGDYDLALVNLDCNNDAHQDALHLLETSPANLPLVINTVQDSDPVATIVWSLVRPHELPAQAAYS